MTIELKNEYLTVQFKTLGGQLTSIKDKDGIEYLWQADPNYWNGQAPILFPICGSLRNDWAIYRPQERPFFTGLIRRHGFVSRAIIKCWFWAIEIVGSFLFIVSFLFLSFHYNFSFDRKVL